MRLAQAGFLAAVCLVGCACDAGPRPAPAKAPASPGWFTDRAAELGLDFAHFNGMSGEHYFAEIMGAGAALIDMDGDGDLDVYLVQGAPLVPGAGPEKTDRLFRNDLVETGRLAFTDVTAESGIEGTEHGMGVASGDYDDDGDVDLYVTAFGDNRLLNNRGDGTFLDVTADAGVADSRFGSAALFTDFDHDGRLDLFVGNYVDYRVEAHEPCFAASGMPDYCSPARYDPLPDALFRNRGDGRFEDVSVRSGIAALPGATLGVVDGDFNDDGLRDLYVANDGMPNRLWVNLGNGTFEDRALIAGCAFNRDGRAEAGMGIAVGDYDEDGDEDLFVTHLARETNTLYRNDSGWFEDVGSAAGLAVPSRPLTGFGTAWIDVDHDGRLDLVVVNGAVTAIEARVRAGDPYPLDQPDRIFLQHDGGVFVDGTERAGLEGEFVGRGLAPGDLDDDGDIDLLVTRNSSKVGLWIRDAGPGGHWLGLALRTRSGGAIDPAARVEVDLADGRTIHRRVGNGGSYLSAGDPRVLVALGDHTVAERVRVRWADGKREWWPSLPADRYHELVRATGRPEGTP